MGSLAVSMLPAFPGALNFGYDSDLKRVTNVKVTMHSPGEGVEGEEEKPVEQQRASGSKENES